MPFKARNTILEASDGPIQQGHEIRSENMSPQEVSRICDDKVLSIKWLARKRLLANSMRCPGRGGVYCGMYMNLTMNRSSHSHPPTRRMGTKSQPCDAMYWRCGTCRKNGFIVKRSIREGSFFSKSKLRFDQAIRVIHTWATNPTASRREILTLTGITQPKTVTDWYNFLREVCMMWCLDPANHVQLGGPGQIVEVDESKLYRAKYNRGRGLFRRHKWVFGLTQRGSHRCVVVPVATRDAATLLPIIQQWVLPGTTIVTDSWAAYGGIGAMQGQNYVHWQVNHRYNFVNPQNPLAHTQGIESMWSNLKRQLHHLQGTSDGLFQSYLYMYMWRRAMHQNQNPFGDILYFIGEYNPL